GGRVPASEWFFFFSSRRRHTRSKRDWSSDVCSSDLYDSASAAVQVSVGASGVGVLGAADNWRNRNCAGAVAGHAAAAQRRNRSEHGGYDSSRCCLPVPLFRNAAFGVLAARSRSAAAD